jgi:hypothetical protein
MRTAGIKIAGCKLLLTTAHKPYSGTRERLVMESERRRWRSLELGSYSPIQEPFMLYIAPLHSIIQIIPAAESKPNILKPPRNDEQAATVSSRLVKPSTSHRWSSITTTKKRLRWVGSLGSKAHENYDRVIGRKLFLPPTTTHDLCRKFSRGRAGIPLKNH